MTDRQQEFDQRVCEVNDHAECSHDWCRCTCHNARLNLAKARELAAQYQSPGAIGRTFAAFASGRQVSYEDFIAECERTATEIGFDSHEDMRLLREWAEETTDDVWTDDPDY